jgi:hypothetical protein
LEYFDEVVDLLEWAEGQGWLLPSTPWFLRRKNKPICHIRALCFEARRLIRRNIYAFKRKNYC